MLGLIGISIDMCGNCWVDWFECNCDKPVWKEMRA